MAASKDLAFPLVVVCLLLLRGSSPLSTTPRAARTTPSDYSDYGDEDDPVTPVKHDKPSPYGKPLQRCDYDPCREGQIPCADLAASSGCLCPGFTLHNVAPEAPTLKSVAWNGSEVVIQWCEPLSDVTAYYVTVGGEERQKFGKGQRSGGVGYLEHMAEVCVVAVNDAGVSEGSCSMFTPWDRTLPLTAGLVGGALGFLLLLLLAVLLWRHRRQRKQEASISMHDTAEPQ